MDNRNNAIPFDKITARDITDTHRRGLAMAAALQFGLASELWAGNMGENPYRPEQAEPVSGNGKTVPATQQEQSSNGSAPSIESLRAEIGTIDKADVEKLLQGFLLDHFPSYKGKFGKDHLKEPKHRIALQELLQQYKTPIAA